MAFNYANQMSVGMIAEMKIWKDRSDHGYSAYSGWAHILGVSENTVDIQWIDVKAGREDSLFSQSMYTEPQSVSRDSILEYSKEQHVAPEVIRHKRRDAILRDQGIFDAYDRQCRDRVEQANAMAESFSENGQQNKYEAEFL